MWHASIRTFKGQDMAFAKELALSALAGVGDSTGEWHEVGPTAFHVRRRLTQQECAAGGGLVMRDIRGTDEERKRLRVVLREVPASLGRLLRLQ